MSRLIANLSSKLRNTSIVIKLIIIYFITIIAPMVVVNYMSHTNSMNFVRTEIENSLLSLSQQINANIEERLKQMDNLTSLLYSTDLLGDIMNKSKYDDNSPDLLDDNREFDRFFNYVLYQSGDIESIYIFTLNDNIFYKSYAGQMKLDYNYSKEPWYQEVLKNKGRITFFGIHHPWPLMRSTTNVFSMSRLIRDMEGNQLGVILIDIKLDTINSYIKKSINNYGSSFIILDNNNNILYNDNTYDINNTSNLNTLRKLVKSGKTTSTGIIDGEKVLLNYRNSSFSGWQIINITPERQITKHTGKLLRFNALIMFISSIVYSLLVLLLYITIYKPIKRLAKSMKLVESGDFSITVPEKSKDEIGQLSSNFNSMISKINILIQKEYKSAILRKDAEFKALQSQINPHFLYNCLQSISSISVVKKVPEINEMSKSLGYMLRYSIKSKSDFVPFALELEHVKSYIAIQKIRLDDRVSVYIDVDEKVNEFGIVKLVLQPFVENAFNHGIEKLRNKGIISLKISYSEGYIVICIIDNGMGIDLEKLAELRESLAEKADENVINSGEGSIGIYNVNSRLRLFYGSEYRLTIESEPNKGTEITIKIPAIKLEEENH